MTRLGWYLGFPLGAAVGASAMAFAGVSHSFRNGETLKAEDLNANFGGLDQRILALEAREPFLGTYPAVLGLGTGYPPGGGPGTDVGGMWFCGGAPETLNLSSAPLTFPTPVTFSHAFGSVLFTNGGALSLNFDFPSSTAPSSDGGPSGPKESPVCNPWPPAICAAPVTFFLKSPRAQTITIRNYLDNRGAIYVDGARKVGNLGTFNTSAISVPAGPFALSFMACSNDGLNIAFVIYDEFLTSADLGLTVDYDRTFHRNNR
jgi:hypothetical protein